ncbi:hypothetical protein EVJ50_13845 [Synechococcus sp. RSCCF101]|uniref:hypothetical protein n=1 Tax=Synechococcus sp. RSCCF101 TaxID=2511069 RepID=UPI001243F4ED|nr:hypothetical protein [Synechococcus sp. RSCCF101]QEY33156.1 hypothetical protein EVJ50_13845 [Synechococcus sp. RSCCF101]
MATCVVVLSKRSQLDDLCSALERQEPGPSRLERIGEGETPVDAVDLLSPNIGRRRRQQRMALWLMPFGFFAGATFTQIADIHPFAFAGAIGEAVLGGILGMGSGWMGSIAAAASVTSDSDDAVRVLRNRLNEGKWLLLIETPMGVPLPWPLLQRQAMAGVVRLSDS